MVEHLWTASWIVSTAACTALLRPWMRNTRDGRRKRADACSLHDWTTAPVTCTAQGATAREGSCQDMQCIHADA